MVVLSDLQVAKEAMLDGPTFDKAIEEIL